jgi:uncharacterized OB-fold protein
MSYEKPLPIINEDNAPYWEYAREHQLRMQKCVNCGHIRFPVSIVCPRCHSLEMEWTRLSGKGKVYSYIIYHQAYHPAYKDDIPYVVAIIQLDEGPRMESNITDCRLEDLRVGMPVELYFDDVTEDVSLPKFRPAEGGQQ